MFKVIDYYEDFFEGDIVDEFETLEEARKCAKDYDLYATDGECDLIIIDNDGKTYTY